MKKNVLLALFSAVIIGFNGCGETNVSNVETNTSTETNTSQEPEIKTKTVMLKITDSKSSEDIKDAQVTIFDENGSAINDTEEYRSDSKGKVEIILEEGILTVSAKVIASAHVNQVSYIVLTEKTTTLTQNVSLLPVGGTVSPVNEGVNVDINGTGAKVDITDAVFKDKNGNIVKPDSIDFTTLNPVEDPDSFPGTADITMEDGSEGIMVSSGMMDVVFKDKEGNPLTLDKNTPVSITMPLFSDVNPETNGTLYPGDSVAFWSMDDETGKWKEETTATVVACTNSPIGICAEGNVTHFSWWNTDFAQRADRRNTVIYNSDTNKSIDDENISTIKLTATFTAVTSDAGNYHGTIAVRSTTIDVFDTISIGVNFDISFMLEITFKDGSKAIKKYDYTWDEIDNLTEFKFIISQTDVYRELSISSYEKEYTQYRKSPISITRSSLGIAEDKIEMSVNGIVGGNEEVGTIVCNRYNRCSYTKGTKAGDMNITATATDGSGLSDSLIIRVTLSLAIKISSSYTYSYTYNSNRSFTNDYDPTDPRNYSYDSNRSNSYTYAYSYYNTYGLYLNNHLLTNAKIKSASSYLYNGSLHELVLNKEDTNLTGYALSIDCETRLGNECEAEDIFVQPFTFNITDLPEAAANINRTNRYYLKATQIADPSVSARMPVYYY